MKVCNLKTKNIQNFQDDFEKFWTVYKLISQQSNLIPVRILQPNHPISQYPCEWKDSNGKLITFAQTLDKLKLLNQKVSVQGITPHKDSPLIWISKTLSHPDGFIYYVVID